MTASLLSCFFAPVLLACYLCLVCSAAGGFFGSIFSLPAWCGRVFFFSCAIFAHLTVSLFRPRVFVRLAQSRRE